MEDVEVEMKVERGWKKEKYDFFEEKKDKIKKI